MPDLPSVLICALGGTIAMTRAGGAEGVVPTQDADALVQAVPQLRSVAQVQAVSFRQVPGAHLTLDDLVELAEFLRPIAADHHGFVVTQGTDTLEETAYTLDLLWDAAAPLVVTGAMRNPTLPGSDGPANLLAATTVAASPQASGLGCVVVLGDEVHAARGVQKRHTVSPAAFVSPGSGPVASVSEGVVAVASTPRRDAVVANVVTPVPAVGLVRLAMGDDGRLLRAAADAGFAGLVVEAFGGGHTTPLIAELLDGLAARMPVILASRTGAGPLLRSTYGFEGSETDLLGRGLISAGTRDGLKARVLLSLLLAGGADDSAIRSAFAS